MGAFSIFHWLVVLAIILIFFAGGLIPGAMRGFVEGVIRYKQQQLQQPSPLRFSRGETLWQAFIRFLRRVWFK